MNNEKNIKYSNHNVKKNRNISKYIESNVTLLLLQYICYGEYNEDINKNEVSIIDNYDINYNNVIVHNNKKIYIKTNLSIINLFHLMLYGKNNNINDMDIDLIIALIINICYINYEDENIGNLKKINENYTCLNDNKNQEILLLNKIPKQVVLKLSYTLATKLNIVQIAYPDYPNDTIKYIKKTAREFSVQPSQIRRWYKTFKYMNCFMNVCNENDKTKIIQRNYSHSKKRICKTVFNI